ncbi:MAG TPA: tyrosine-protein phosphatase, partial [Gaiellaceae bacterium]
MSRALAWDGCVNVRDLGGLPTEDGGVTLRGAVVRSDNARRLSDAGWQALLDHGVRTVVDLRWADERDEDPPGDVPIAT